MAPTVNKGNCKSFRELRSSHPWNYIQVSKRREKGNECSAQTLGPAHLGPGARTRAGAPVSAGFGARGEAGKEVRLQHGGGAQLRSQVHQVPCVWAQKGQKGQQEGEAGLHLMLLAGAAGFCRAQGLLIAPSGDFPMASLWGKRKAPESMWQPRESQGTQEPESPPHLVSDPHSISCPLTGYLLPNINSNVLFQT